MTRTTADPVRVTRVVRAPQERVWALTQDPALHERWDARFSEIRDLAGPDGVPAGQERPFRYATRLGPLATIAGWGRAAAVRRRASTATSALAFGSADLRSPIRRGAGYWRYEEEGDAAGAAVRFSTRYDYETRWGRPGRWLDRRALRPAMAWATAWSFDRLALWAERGLPPEAARRAAVAHGAATAAVAGTLAWHGLVPKLHPAGRPAEVALAAGAGVPTRLAPAAVTALGAVELGWAGVVVAHRHRRWPFAVTLAALPLLAAAGLRADRALAAQPFSPVSLTTAVAALCATALATGPDVPTATRARWGPHPLAGRRPDGRRTDRHDTTEDPR